MLGISGGRCTMVNSSSNQQHQQQHSNTHRSRSAVNTRIMNTTTAHAAVAASGSWYIWHVCEVLVASRSNVNLIHIQSMCVDI